MGAVHVDGRQGQVPGAYLYLRVQGCEKVLESFQQLLKIASRAAGVDGRLKRCLAELSIFVAGPQGDQGLPQATVLPDQLIPALLIPLCTVKLTSLLRLELNFDVVSMFGLRLSPLVSRLSA